MKELSHKSIIFPTYSTCDVGHTSLKSLHQISCFGRMSYSFAQTSIPSQMSKSHTKLLHNDVNSNLANDDSGIDLLGVQAVQ